MKRKFRQEKYAGTRPKFVKASALHWCSVQRREDGVGGELDREFVDVGFHSWKPVIVEAEGIHFRGGLVRRPVLLRDAIGRDHHAGAVLPIVAMDENFLRGILLHEF